MEVDSTSQATISEILKLWTVQDDILLMASVHHVSSFMNSLAYFDHSQ